MKPSESKLQCSIGPLAHAEKRALKGPEAFGIGRAVIANGLPALWLPIARNPGRITAAGLPADALVRNRETIAEPAMHVATDTLARLISLACGVAAEDQPEAVRIGRLVATRRHIAQHLANPDLSPASAAAAVGISVRAPHLAFEPTGKSFARYVSRRRLEACRDALLANHTRPVNDIAFAWGFGTLSSFYRAFHAAFGMSPGDP